MIVTCKLENPPERLGPCSGDRDKMQAVSLLAFPSLASECIRFCSALRDLFHSFFARDVPVNLMNTLWYEIMLCVEEPTKTLVLGKACSSSVVSFDSEFVTGRQHEYDVSGDVRGHRSASIRRQAKAVGGTQGALFEHVEDRALADIARAGAAASVRCALGCGPKDTNCWHSEALECVGLAYVHLGCVHWRTALAIGWREEDVTHERAREALE